MTEVYKLTFRANELIALKQTNSAEFKTIINELILMSNAISNTSSINDKEYRVPPAHDLVKDNKFVLLNAMLESGLNINLYNKNNSFEGNRGTLLMVALKSGNLDAYEYLVQKGADKDYHGEVLIAALEGYRLKLLEAYSLESDLEAMDAAEQRRVLKEEFKPIIKDLVKNCSKLEDSAYVSELKSIAQNFDFKLNLNNKQEKDLEK